MLRFLKWGIEYGAVRNRDVSVSEDRIVGRVYVGNIAKHECELTHAIPGYWRK